MQVSRRVYKGVPDRWRAAAWGTLIDQMEPRSSKGKGRATDEQLLEEYQVSLLPLRKTDPGRIKLTSLLSLLPSTQQVRIDQPSTFDVQIDLDVPRTISGHVLFHTRYGLG